MILSFNSYWTVIQNPYLLNFKQMVLSFFLTQIQDSYSKNCIFLAIMWLVDYLKRKRNHIGKVCTIIFPYETDFITQHC